MALVFRSFSQAIAFYFREKRKKALNTLGGLEMLEIERYYDIVLL
jgi:hypothetical protein